MQILKQLRHSSKVHKKYKFNHQISKITYSECHGVLQSDTNINKSDSSLIIPEKKNKTIINFYIISKIICKIWNKSNFICSLKPNKVVPQLITKQCLGFKYIGSF